MVHCLRLYTLCNNHTNNIKHSAPPDNIQICAGATICNSKSNRERVPGRDHTRERGGTTMSSSKEQQQKNLRQRQYVLTTVVLATNNDSRRLLTLPGAAYGNARIVYHCLLGAQRGLPIGWREQTTALIGPCDRAALCSRISHLIQQLEH